jgi:hypothetical protein
LKEKIAILEEADWVKGTDQDPEEVDRDHREDHQRGSNERLNRDVFR